MEYIHESEEQKPQRQRTGKIAAAVAISWWVASIGGIIYVINATT